MVRADRCLSRRKTYALIAPAHWRDGIVGCATADGKFVITSPTVDCIPRPALGTILLNMREDCLYGEADPLLRPQLLSDGTRFPWLAAVRLPNPQDPVIGIMWRTLHRETHYQVDGKSGLGTACRTLLAESAIARNMPARLVAAFERRYGYVRDLRWLYNSFVDAVDRLDFPCTFRDLARQWACVQRYWSYTLAWIHWNVGITARYSLDARDYEPVARETCMGCFTTSPTLAAGLAKLYLPVWFMRTFNELSGDDVIERAVAFDDWPSTMMFKNEAHRRDHEALFAGKVSSVCLAGDGHLTWILQQSARYFDRETNPVPSDNVAASSSTQPTSEVHTSTPGVARPLQNAKHKFHPCEFSCNFV